MPRGHYRIMCVCLGNICRSPMAEAVLSHAVATAGFGDRVSVRSTGTAAFHVGSPMDPRAAATLAGSGYPNEHTARQLTAHELSNSDLVLAMDASNLSHVQQMADTVAADPPRIRLLRHYDAQLRDGDVPDPYYGGRAGFQDVLAIVERTADDVVADVLNSLGP